jgi:hypothetical protein
MTRIAGLLLALIVALTSQQLALARGQADMAGSITLCSGGGFVTVAVDAKGNPVGPAHICPDGIAALFGVTAENPDLAWRHVPFRVVDPVRTALIEVPQDAVRTARARGPPPLA